MALTEFVHSFGLSSVQWGVIVLSTLLIGISRTGIFGVMLLAVPVLSLFMEGRAAAGLVLPMMVAADFVAAFLYRKTFDKKAVIRILPWLILGVFAGVLIGGAVSNRIFKMLMAATTFTCAGFVIWREIRPSEPAQLSLGTVAVIGLLSGFASMIGNAAGPIIAVYFFSLKLKKIAYVSSMVWLFWIVNMIKFPLHIFLWETIDMTILGLDLLMAPVLAVGLGLGVWVIKRIPEKPFRMVILVSILIAGITLLFS